MKLKIIEVNFTSNLNWLYKLINQEGSIFYIMQKDFYDALELHSPVTKRELDCYDTGHFISADVVQNNDANIVTRIF